MIGKVNSWSKNYDKRERFETRRNLLEWFETLNAWRICMKEKYFGDWSQSLRAWQAQGLEVC